MSRYPRKRHHGQQHICTSLRNGKCCFRPVVVVVVVRCCYRRCCQPERQWRMPRKCKKTKVLSGALSHPPPSQLLVVHLTGCGTPDRLHSIPCSRYHSRHRIPRLRPDIAAIAPFFPFRASIHSFGNKVCKVPLFATVGTNNNCLRMRFVHFFFRTIQAMTGVDASGNGGMTLSALLVATTARLPRVKTF